MLAHVNGIDRSPTPEGVGGHAGFVHFNQSSHFIRGLKFFVIAFPAAGLYVFWDFLDKV
jgi:hypothetical protein